MKLFFWTLLLGIVVVPSYAKAVVYDLKQVMQDRYEKDCTIRDGYDLYEFPDIDKVLKTHVIKNKFVEDNTLSVHISRIRKQLGCYRNNYYIETIKGVGYRWNTPITWN